jgi:hypothetical protein
MAATARDGSRLRSLFILAPCRRCPLRGAFNARSPPIQRGIVGLTACAFAIREEACRVTTIA